MTIPRGPATTLTTHGGKPVDLVTKAWLVAAEEELGYPLTVVQGYNPDNTTTSAGTHLYGMVDLAPYDWLDKLLVLCKLGGFGWHREEIPGYWGEHIHVGVRNHPGLAEPAKTQQEDFDARPPRTGLKYHLRDDSVLTYRPTKPVEFTYPPKKEIIVPEPTEVQKARDEISRIDAAASEAIAHLREVDENRKKPRAYRDDLRAIRAKAQQILDEMPLR